MRCTRIQIHAGAYLGAAASILLLPLNWMIGWVLASLIHEAGHLAALLCCHVPILEMELGLFGAKISTGPMTASQELLCAAAGPFCSFLLLFLAQRVPAAAIIGLMQGLFNLLPIYPLDGGRMVRSAAMIRK